MSLAERAEPSVFTTNPPIVDADEAAALIARLFGIDGVARPLAGERDRNFHVVARDGRAFVLKVGNAAEDASIGDLQARALLHIAAHAPDLPVPVVQPTREGALQVTTEIAAGTHHVVRVLSYLRGEPLHAAPATPIQAENLGRCLAALGIALRDFRHAAARHPLIWDLQEAARLRPHASHIEDEELRRLARVGLDRFDAETAPRMAGFRRQVVHNDFNPHNILVDPADPDRITGVLDFGDIVETPLINDVAVAASYQAVGPDPLGRVAALVAAYHAINPLRPDEVDVLFDLIMLRQIMSVTIAAWRASLYPDNRAYIVRNQVRVSAALLALDAIGLDRGRARLHDACRGERSA